MTTRALNRIGQPAAPLIDLPTAVRPQVVDEAGFELGEEEIVAGERALARGSGDVLREDGDGDVEMAEEREQVGLRDKESKEPLLNLGESLVLPCSLTLTRQHHLTHLLPHIFSHPVVPSHSRPRARGPPKTTFLFPTPPPPTVPLPFREYHGPLAPVEISTSKDDSVDGSTGGGLATPPEKAKKPKAPQQVGPPAHEIDCIARVTLSVGPIAYPGTELWVGRFVEPRLLRPKEKRDKVKRQSLMEAAVARRAGPSSTHHAALKPPVATSTPTATPRIPYGPAPPPRPPVAPGLPGPPRPPGQNTAQPPRNPLPPSLIQRVNAAAAQHPWLSFIIHKAARSSASKEELAKLGRVVARLGRGEGVGEGPDEGLSRPLPGPSIAPIPLTGPTGAEDDSSDSDSDVDMTGPKQVGGGPLSSEFPDAPSTVAPISSFVPPTRPHDTPAFSTFLPRQSPLTNVPFQTEPSTPESFPSRPSQAYTPSPSTTPAPPRPVYPPQVPFLLIAFKEAPTEKFLLPLGSQSYLSRVGGDYVTGPPPIEKVVPAFAPPTQVVPAQPIAPVSSVADIPPDTLNETNLGRGKGRTRASVGRGKQEAPAVIIATREPGPETVIDESEPPPQSAHLPLLPGMKPSNGTVLLSTLVPADGWVRPDWTEVDKRLPYNRGKATQEAKTEQSPAQPLPSFNFAAESLLPSGGKMNAVTIRLTDVDDRVWRRIKSISEEVQRVEMIALGIAEPQLLALEPPERLGPDAQQPVRPLSQDENPRLTPLVRSTYLQRKRSHITSLLQRAPSRPFLRYRLPTPLSALIEATTDKWGPRRYPISTKPLYTTDDTDLSRPLPTPSSPERPRKKRRKEDKPEVTFEMPVSLDALDERVAEGAMRGTTKRERGRGAPKAGEGKRKAGARAVAGRVCEGCAGVGLKVWRRGPGGKGTLCYPCGDKFLAGTLGELKAPDVASNAVVAANGKEADAVVSMNKDVEQEQITEIREEVATTGPAKQTSVAAANGSSATEAEPLIEVLNPRPVIEILNPDAAATSNELDLSGQLLSAAAAVDRLSRDERITLEPIRSAIPAALEARSKETEGVE